MCYHHKWGWLPCYWKLKSPSQSWVHKAVRSTCVYKRKSRGDLKYSWRSSGVSTDHHHNWLCSMSLSYMADHSRGHMRVVEVIWERGSTLILVWKSNIWSIHSWFLQIYKFKITEIEFTRLQIEQMNKSMCQLVLFLLAIEPEQNNWCRCMSRSLWLSINRDCEIIKDSIKLRLPLLNRPSQYLNWWIYTQIHTHSEFAMDTSHHFTCHLTLIC